MSASSWRTHTDRWAGFALERPAAWEARATRGIITVREDVLGLTSAFLWPVRFQQPLSAEHAASQFVAWARQSNPTIEAWRVPSKGAGRVVLRTRSRREGQLLDGHFTVTVSGADGLLAGFQAPTERVEVVGPVMSHILASFQPVSPVPRVSYREPMEGAFSALVPQGWGANGGVNRQNAYGIAFTQFQAWEASGAARVAVPNHLMPFADGWTWMWGMPGVERLSYAPAREFAARSLASMIARQAPDLRVEGVVDRPDLLPLLQMETLKAGMSPEGVDLSAAVLDVTFSEGSGRHRQKSCVYVMRPKAGMFSMMNGVWYATIASHCRAPVERFEEAEPVLVGVIESFQQTPQWEQMEHARNQRVNAQMQADTLARTRQISRTLSETSDIITSGYWERQRTTEHLSQAWSNAMLGRQDMVDPSGTVYNVPNSYDQYWRDNQGNVVGGGWLVNPDPTWTRLEPTGV